ncbi:hypothetical protein EBX31_11555 [bacterium]|nr:hypothetical protein [bacterium]
MRSIFAILLFAAVSSHAQNRSDLTRVPIVFSGGYETDPRDHGRPVVLIAGALGVSPEVFRDAFRRVHPANPEKGPVPAEAQANKTALLTTLGKYGVTNERLDQVSDYYRYVASRHELWPTQPAAAYALVQNEKIVGYEIVSGGSGYSSSPAVTVPGFPGHPIAELLYEKSFEKNGSIRSIRNR